MSLKTTKGLKMKAPELLHPEQRCTSKAYLVRELHKAVCTRREQGYHHTIETTRRLLQFRFEEDHFGHNAPFHFNSGYFSIPYTKVDKNRNYGA
jgi:hypothetical protein